MISKKKMLGCALAAMMAMQSSGVVFASEQKTSYSINQSQEVNYTSLLNYMLDNGYLTTDTDNNLLVTEKYKNYVEEKIKSINKDAVVIVNGNSITIASKNDSGVSKFEWTYKGFDLWLSHEDTSNAKSAATLTCIVTGIVPDLSLVSKIVSGIIALGAYVLEQQDLGNGVIIAFIYPCIPHWVSSQ